jgi:hypothetical protein
MRGIFCLAEVSLVPVIRRIGLKFEHLWDFPRFTRHALCLRTLTTDLECVCLGTDFTCSSSKYIINVRSSSCELVFFDLTKIETDKFSRKSAVCHFTKIHELFHGKRQADARKGRHDEVSSQVSKVAV